MQAAVNRDLEVDKMGEANTTFGSLRLRNAATNEIILIPTPSNDPNDPLNWLVRSIVQMAFQSRGYVFK